MIFLKGSHIQSAKLLQLCGQVEKGEKPIAFFTKVQ
jgi:hypothetical protein